MSKVIELLDGQMKFINSDKRYSGYIGGVGSGKTFAGVTKGLLWAQQPKIGFAGPRGIMAAASYRMLEDVVLPEFFAQVDGTGLLDTSKGTNGYAKQDKKAYLVNGGEIWFRSLDDPNSLRGPNLSWFFIDEGRETNRKAWDVLIGRIRQPGYKHGGWVTSTPSGYDWMWNLFAPESPNRLPDADVFFADTRENYHLDPEYRKALEASYEGKFFEQEVMGRFIGLIGGGVFPEWNIERQTRDIPFDPTLPLYSFWDFGVGDLGVCMFAQVDHRPKTLHDGTVVFVPYLIFLDYIEAANWSTDDWASAWHNWCHEHTDGRLPEQNFGDPAGKQRSHEKTSTIDALNSKHVPVRAAPIRPIDYGVLTLRNLMEGGRVFVSSHYFKDKHGNRVGQAFTTHKWDVDEDGNRIGKAPIHDWTSHYAAAARYGVASVSELSYHHTPKRPEEIRKYPVGSAGWVFGQMIRQKNRKGWLGQSHTVKRPKWHPRIGERT